MCACSDENNGQSGCCCCDRICVCVPYVDGYMITAQLFSIVAFLISWIWAVTFFVGGLCFVLLQVIWYCRQNKIGLYVSAGVSTFAAVLCTIAGIVMIVGWKDKVNCKVWMLTGDDDYTKYYNDDEYWGDKAGTRRDYCEEDIWATVAFVTAALWFITTGCILYFVKSGRYTRWEEKLQADTTTTTTVATTPTTTAIEMGTVQHHHNDNDEHHHQQQQSTIAVVTASATAATSYVLPDIPDKIDDV
mmetsp:Transcript_42479/g.43257  ORF Transcript_42479/g.43257 Transcript_42479/m.43257 type:complete len:246 (-) Transcript_42479:164-901(-)